MCRHYLSHKMIIWVSGSCCAFPSFCRHAYVHTHTLCTHTYTPTRSGSKLKRGDTDRSLSVCAQWERASHWNPTSVWLHRVRIPRSGVHVCLPSTARYDRDVVLGHHITAGWRWAFRGSEASPQTTTRLYFGLTNYAPDFSSWLKARLSVWNLPLQQDTAPTRTAQTPAVFKQLVVSTATLHRYVSSCE